MTDKFKKRVRARMSRTGESYTAARRSEFEEAHAQGLHDESPREGCPICDDKKRRV